MKYTQVKQSTILCVALEILGITLTFLGNYLTSEYLLGAGFITLFFTVVIAVITIVNAPSAVTNELEDNRK